MSPKSLADLQLNAEELPPMPLDDLPEFGGMPTPPQPGAYRFKLPDMKEVFETYDAVIDGKTVQRLKVVFDRTHPLLITAGARSVGETFQTQINGTERDRGKDKSVKASDLDYLMKALGLKTRPANMAAMGEFLVAQSGKEFGADVTFNWNCNPNRKIRVLDANGKNVEGETNGCGRKFYQADHTSKPEQKIERDAAGLYPVELKCSCGNIIRTFGNLDNLRP